MEFKLPNNHVTLMHKGYEDVLVNCFKLSAIVAVSYHSPVFGHGGALGTQPPLFVGHDTVV